MKCTECDSEEYLLHGIRWNSEYGFIIKEGELLCDNCAEKRPGFLQSGDLLKSREKEYASLVTNRPEQ